MKVRLSDVERACEQSRLRSESRRRAALERESFFVGLLFVLLIAIDWLVLFWATGPTN